MGKQEEKQGYHAKLVDIKLRFRAENSEENIPDYREIIKQRAKDKGFIQTKGETKGQGNINSYIIDLIEQDIRTTEGNADFSICTTGKKDIK